MPGNAQCVILGLSRRAAARPDRPPPKLSAAARTESGRLPRVVEGPPPSRAAADIGRPPSGDVAAAEQFAHYRALFILRRICCCAT